jgi:hypothetical protein
MAIHAMTYAPKLVLGLHIAFSWLYAGAAAGYILLLALKARTLDCSRREKALYLWSGASAAAILLNIVVWQLYRF